MKTFFVIGLLVLSGCTNAGPFVTNISSDGRGNIMVEKAMVRMNSFTGTISDGADISSTTIRVWVNEDTEKPDN